MSTLSNRLGHRSVLGKASAIAVSAFAMPTIILRAALAGSDRHGANDRVRVGCISTGGLLLLATEHYGSPRWECRMQNLRLVVTLACLCSYVLTPLYASDVPVTVRPFLEQHCFGCHDKYTSEGDLNLQAMDLSGTTANSRSFFCFSVRSCNSARNAAQE